MMNEIKIGKVIKYLSVSLEKMTNNLLKSSELSLSQSLLLVWLSGAPNKVMTIKEIEKKYGTAQSTTYGIVSRLEAKGYISTESLNAKTKIVKLCDEGEKKIEFIEQCIATSENKLFSNFSQGERAIFTELLIKAQNNLDI